MRSVFRIASLLLLGGLTVTAGFARLTNTSQADQEVQVIEISAKKYEYTPSPIRAKRGAKVQLRITALDRAHGFKINLSPDGSDKKSDAGLIFSSNDDCFKLEKGIPTVVEFVARTAGHLLLPLLQSLRDRPRRNEGPARRRAINGRELQLLPF